MVATNPPLSFPTAECLARAEDFARLAGEAFRQSRGRVGKWSWTRYHLEKWIVPVKDISAANIRRGLLMTWMGCLRPLDTWYPWCWPHYVATTRLPSARTGRT